MKDRKYCKWLLQQDWFQTQYEHLYNQVKSYEPRKAFFKEILTYDNFINSYPYFNLKKLSDVELELTTDEKACYNFYRSTVKDLKLRIKERKECLEENIYDIKAPTNWLKKFENESGLERNILKLFLSGYELPSLASIVEDIKAQGGIEYKGTKSFKIAKERSIEQEEWWMKVLKSKFDADISSQFKYNNCFFDFINIRQNTIFECKLNIKDFNEDQFKKYQLILKTYKIIYLISTDCIIDITNNIMYTENKYKYDKDLYSKKNLNWLEQIVKDMKIIEVENIQNVIDSTTS